MARIHQPRQRKSDSRWDYTISSDEEGWAHPAGYCAGWREWTEKDVQLLFNGNAELAAKELAERLPFKQKYHKDGHATAEEATKCHREYELDQELHFFVDPRSQEHCQVCGEWTQGRARLGEFQYFILCNNHQKRSVVTELMK